MDEELDNNPVEMPTEATRITYEIHVMLQKSQGCNNESGTWNCNKRNEEKKPNHISGFLVMVKTEILLGDGINLTGSMK